MARLIALAAAALVAALPASSASRQITFARLIAPGLGLVASDALFVWSSGTWYHRASPRGPGSLMDAYFRDEQHGWLALNDCAGARAAVYRTVDGGRSWKPPRVDPVNCAGGSRLVLASADDRHGWLERTFANGSFATLDRTTDGGAT